MLVLQIKMYIEGGKMGMDILSVKSFIMLL